MKFTVQTAALELADDTKMLKTKARICPGKKTIAIQGPGWCQWGGVCFCSSSPLVGGVHVFLVF